MNSFLEQIIFFYILKHENLVHAFKPEFFTSKQLQVLFSIVKPFIIEYKEEPSEDQVNDLIKIADKQEILTPDVVHILWQNREKVSGYSEDWLSQNTRSYAEWQNLMTAIKRVLTYVKSVQTDVTFENCSDIVNKVKMLFTAETNFNITASKGHDFFDPITHQTVELETSTSGYPFLDRCLGGGFALKTLNVLMGAPKVGKTHWLCNLASKSVINGYNTAFISCELAFQKVSQRIGSNLFNVPYQDYKVASNDANYVRGKMQEFHTNNMFNKPGAFILEEFPTSTATVPDIESFLLAKEEELSTPDAPFKFKRVFIDYLNILKDQYHPNTENMYLKIKSIAEQLRAAAIRNNWCIVSVTQINRSGVDASDMTMANVSESMGLVATVDLLMGIIQNTLMKASNVYYLKAIAVRDAETMNWKKKYNFDGNFLRIEEDPDEDPITDSMEMPSIYNVSTGFANVGKIQPKVVEQSSTELPPMPQLGVSEAQLGVNSLFNM